MIQHYLKSAWRNLKVNKLFSILNIVGLAVGISASLVIFIIIQYDYSFDKWEPQRDHIYRVYTQDKIGTNSGISLLAPAAIKENITGIETVSHFIESPFDFVVAIPNVSKGNPKIFTKSEGICFADENYFTIFPHQWLAGNAQSLAQLNHVVLSLSEAEKYFPKLSPDKMIGKNIVYNDSINTTVSGIIADLKVNTDFDNKSFISLKTFMTTNLINAMGTAAWNSVNSSSQCMIVINKSASIENINAQIKKLFVENAEEPKDKYMQIGALDPLSDVHFNPNIDAKVTKSSLRDLSLLALLLLLLAAINFINLSTAQSTLRSKEIGVRKTFGANKKQIIYQFLTETLLLTVCATLFALIISPLLLYVFKAFIPNGLEVTQMFQPMMIVVLIATIVVVTLLAGLYPAFVLSKFRPALVLKSQISNKGKSGSERIRQFLTVSQFLIAQVFLVFVFVIAKQIHFVLNKDLGFRKDAIVSFFIPDAFQARGKSLKGTLMNELRKIPDIQNISISSGLPARNGMSSTSVTWNNKGNEKTFDNVHVRTIDTNYLSVFNLNLIDGKNIHIDTSAKIADALINETLLHKMGFHNPQEAIGQYFSHGLGHSSQIVGVLKDFTTMSLHSQIQPTVIFADDANWGFMMSILLNKNNPDSWKTTIDKTGDIFKEFYPDKEFEYKFFDESIKNLYVSDIRLSALLKWATGLAIFISCLGLLGLVSFMANQRTKEIGVRKVLGASVRQIIALLSRSLIRLVIIASVLAFPIAWFFTDKWLQGFAYKTNLSWWIFAVSDVTMLLIALGVLYFRTLKSAKANPVDSLRAE